MRTTMSDRLQILPTRRNFPPSAMNDFSRMEESAAAKLAGEKTSAASVEITALGGVANFPLVNPTTNESHMNRHNPTNELIVSGIHLELTPSLKTFVREKAERLFRHEDRIVRLRIELECDSKQSVANRFSAKGHISILGPDLNASVSSDECHKAVALLVDKLDRMLHRRSHLKKVKRHHPHAIELNAALPKAV
jgi:putative sigma-54 modulation protein